jgi:hypothetical protein
MYTVINSSKTDESHIFWDSRTYRLPLLTFPWIDASPSITVHFGL